ncbi:MAG: hypothetical protein FWE11_05535 [Defluviitaleaceae bacterium]|nr:hypothetical protein [Defluviitaleaceae bacterium]
MSKNKKDGSATGNVGSLEAANDFMQESSGTTVQNPDQNKEIHKAALGRNAHR